MCSRIWHRSAINKDQDGQSGDRKIVCCRARSPYPCQDQLFAQPSFGALTPCGARHPQRQKPMATHDCAALLSRYVARPRAISSPTACTTAIAAGYSAKTLIRRPARREAISRKSIRSPDLFSRRCGCRATGRTATGGGEVSRATHCLRSMSAPQRV